jgi:nucleoside-diphosphate-sugar epimerase
MLQSLAGTSLPVLALDQLRSQEIPEARADIALAREILGWKPSFGLAEGLRDILELARL